MLYVRPQNYSGLSLSAFKEQLASWYAAGDPLVVYYASSTPEVTDISDILTISNVLPVEAGGTITMVNEHSYDVPSSVDFYEDINEIVGAKTFVGDLVGTAGRAIADENGNRIDVTAYAPAGYGLGGECVEVLDWNTATENGFYWDTNGEDRKHSPFLGMAAWGYTVAVKNDDAITQVAFTYATPNWNHALVQKIRHLKGAVGWSEWEWVNPPMEVGVEYRSTERWYGKPVYTRLVYCGELPPVGQSKEVGIYKFGVTNVLEICGTMSTGDNLPYLNYAAYSTANPHSQINFTATKDNIKIATVAWGATSVEVTSITATARIKYVYG